MAPDSAPSPPPPSPAPHEGDASENSPAPDADAAAPPDRVALDDLVAARTALHHAVALLCGVVDSLSAEFGPIDCRLDVGTSQDGGTIVRTRELAPRDHVPGRSVRFLLHLPSTTYRFLDGDGRFCSPVLSLVGQTRPGALGWITNHAVRLLDCITPITEPRHSGLPHHPFADGEPFAPFSAPAMETLLACVRDGQAVLEEAARFADPDHDGVHMRGRALELAVDVRVLPGRRPGDALDDDAPPVRTLGLSLGNAVCREPHLFCGDQQSLDGPRMRSRRGAPIPILRATEWCAHPDPVERQRVGVGFLRRAVGC